MLEGWELEEVHRATCAWGQEDSSQGGVVPDSSLLPRHTWKPSGLSREASLENRAPPEPSSQLDLVLSTVLARPASPSCSKNPVKALRETLILDIWLLACLLTKIPLPLGFPWWSSG